MGALLAGLAAATLLATWLPATTGDTTASRVLGQATLTTNSPGAGADGLSGPLSVAIDRTSTPDHLYVVDTKNNRVLGFRDAEEFANGSAADIVIGQPNLCSTLCNAGGRAGPETLCAPSAVTVDNRGILYIADAGNNRVLVYESPFTAFEEAGQTAGFNPSHVLGQATFNGAACNKSATALVPPNGATLCNPQGLAVNQDDQLFVADSNNNRVLEYYNPLDGSAANIAIGQPDFSGYKCAQGGAANTASATSLCAPRGLALDSNGNLYVADTNDNRVTEYDAQTGTGGAAHLVFGQPGMASTVAGGCAGGVASADSLCAPQGVALDDNDDLYVADSGNNRILEYDDPAAPGPSSPGQPGSSGDTTADMVFGHGGNFTATAANDGGVSADSLSGPGGVALDEAGSLYVADTDNNRVTKYNSASVPLTGETKITPAATPARTPCPPANVAQTLKATPAPTEAPPQAPSERTAPQSEGITAAPKTVNFGKVDFYDSTDVLTATKTITLTNSSKTAFADTLTVVASATGTDFSADFVATDSASKKQCNGTVKKHGSCPISVTFTPSGVQKETAVLEVQDSSSNVVAKVTLKGQGVGGPIVISPKALSVSFSKKVANGSTGTQVKDVKITGKFASPIEITISNIAVTLKDGVTPSFEYSIDLTNCGAGTFPLTVDKSTPCTVGVTFTPFTGKKGKADIAYLTISDDAGTGTQKVKLSGLATGPAQPTPTPPPVLTPSPTPTPSTCMQFCNGACADSDPNNCGACGVSCDPANGGTCSADTCTCPATDNGGVACPDGACASNTNSNDCGSCGNACDVTDGGSCSAGSCICPSGDNGGQPCPDGLCHDLNTDPNNCGTCGNSCGSGNSCSSGSCVTGCVGSEPNLCNGTCTNTQTDVNNCGGCGIVCNIPGTCTSGTCSNGVASPTPTPAATPTPAPGPQIVPNVLFRFDSVEVGSSLSVTVTIVNDQPNQLNFTNAASGSVAMFTSETPGVAGDYTEADAPTNGCAAGSPIPAFGSCMIVVTFMPSAGGPRIATMTLVDDFMSLLPQDASLQGIGIAPATPTPVSTSTAPGPGTHLPPELSPSTLTFGAVQVGNTGGPLEVHVKNTSGSAMLTILGAAVSNPNFAADTSSCTANPLPPLTSCTIGVTFTPPGTGTQVGFLTVSSDGVGTAPGPTAVELTGSGVAVLATPTPVAGQVPSAPRISPSLITFPGEQIGTSSSPIDATVTNTSSLLPLTLTGVTFSGSAAGDFAETDNCTASPILPGHSCTVAVTFTPTQSGSRVADLTVAGDFTGLPPVTEVVGVGQVPPTPTPVPTAGGPGSHPPPVLTPSSVSFGSVALDASVTKDVTAKNTSGTAQLNITGASVNNPAFTADASACTAASPIPPQGTCIIAVTFTPTSPGAQTGSLTVASDGSGSAPGPTSAQLTGSGSVTAATPTPVPGQSPPPPQIAPSSLSFGGVAVGSSSSPKNVTITNESSLLPLAISAINPGGADPGDFSETDTCTTNPVAPSGTCTISVTFTPTEKGSRTATFTLQDNAQTNVLHPQTFSVSGVGQ